MDPKKTRQDAADVVEVLKAEHGPQVVTPSTTNLFLRFAYAYVGLQPYATVVQTLRDLCAQPDLSLLKPEYRDPARQDPAAIRWIAPDIKENAALNLEHFDHEALRARAERMLAAADFTPEEGGDEGIDQYIFRPRKLTDDLVVEAEPDQVEILRQFSLGEILQATKIPQFFAYVITYALARFVLTDLMAWPATFPACFDHDMLPVRMSGDVVIFFMLSRHTDNIDIFCKHLKGLYRKTFKTPARTRQPADPDLDTWLIDAYMRLKEEREAAKQFKHGLWREIALRCVERFPNLRPPEDEHYTRQFNRLINALQKRHARALQHLSDLLDARAFPEPPPPD